MRIAMKEKKITVLIREYLLNELDEMSRRLVEEAREATKRAYAPYSAFRVGAALLLENGEIITGNNQENAAYPSGLCAERVAVFYAGARYPDVAIVAMALTARKKEDFTEEPAYPCGACRQVLLEAENRSGKPIRLIMAGRNKADVVSSVQELLPKNFDKRFLE
jgi:cytidine deaminase